jgi:lipoteichoic acid synthase
MDKGQINEQENQGDEGTDIGFDSIDASNLYVVTRDIELENLIKSDMMNIDTLNEDKGNNEDAASLEERKADQQSLSLENAVGFWNKRWNNLKESWNGKVELSRGNLVFPLLFIIGTVIYLELLTHIINYRSLDIKIIYPVLFVLPPGLLIGFMTGLFKSVINRIIFWIITGLTCLIFAVQLIYYYVFHVYFSFQSLGMADDAVSEFGADIFTAIRANILKLLLMFLPLFLLGIFINKSLDFSKRGVKPQTFLLASTVAFQVVAVVALLLGGRGDYSPYDLYHKSKVMNLCGKELGIFTMTRFDLGRLIIGDDDLVLADTISIPTDITYIPTSAPPIAVPTGTVNVPGVTLTPTPVPIDTSPNVMDFDFAALSEKEDKKTYKTLDQYFASVTPTDKNEYTGMFEGYNLILLTAEGFSPFAVNEEKTPTLYRLTHEGFVFNNFYTPLWQTSTSDGEYCALTGMIPTEIRNMYKGRHNLWPFSLGNQFDKLGVVSRAYHDNTYTYYERNETHPNLGYIFTAKGNGLTLEHPDYWPESDLEMINSTVDDYMNEKQFHVYYMTVSGHMNYTFSGNMMSYKNRELVADLPYSDDVKAYIACQSELDKALEELIKRLEEAGVADHTVIALSADHYPYAWDKSIIDEAAGHEVDPNFELFQNRFILWSEGMKESVVIDKPCSSLDILPTLSNLFGLEYDSRLLMGQDILSDAPPLVMLSNRSFITDKVMYNAVSGEVTMLTGEELPEDYISNLNKIIKNKFAVSESVLEADYYRHLFEETGK